ncbi:hypothetical protein QM012_003510 [Aureobasidium pullulans]|uniref:Uncharacterized protein n=1 Tax=Aureobasidium pullulans TaxID=5580 RepID=A0ABR0T9X7_AURPU
MDLSTFSVRRCSTSRTFRGHKRTHFDYTIDFPNRPSGDTVHIQPISLSLPHLTPSIYFETVIIAHDSYHLIVITLITINMDHPDRNQFMAGVNSTGPHGRLLPAGAAAAARMTANYAAEQEAARQQDEETFSTASTAIEEAKREEKAAKKKKAGSQTSLFRRLFAGVGDKFTAAVKRDQEKKNQ